MAGAGISGVSGDLKISGNQLSEIKGWEFSPKITTPQYASNKTAGYKRTRGGVKSGSGNVEGVWDPNNPATNTIDVGTAATLALFLDAAASYSVPSILGDFQLKVDLNEGEIVSWTSKFVADGAWTNPGAGWSLPPGMFPDPIDGDEFGLPDRAKPLDRDAVKALTERVLKDDFVDALSLRVARFLQKHGYQSEANQHASKVANDAILREVDAEFSSYKPAA